MTHTQQSAYASWLVIAAGIVAAMHIGKLPPTIPVLQQQLSLSLNQSGFLLAAIQVAGIAMALFIGLMAEKIGLKRLQVGGLLVLAVASFLGSYAGSFTALFAARLLEGFGFLSIVLAGPSLIKHLVPAQKLKPVLGFWAAYMGLGVATSLILAPTNLKPSCAVVVGHIVCQLHQPMVRHYQLLAYHLCPCIHSCQPSGHVDGFGVFEQCGRPHCGRHDVATGSACLGLVDRRVCVDDAWSCVDICR